MIGGLSKVAGATSGKGGIPLPSKAQPPIRNSFLTLGGGGLAKEEVSNVAKGLGGLLGKKNK